MRNQIICSTLVSILCAGMSTAAFAADLDKIVSLPNAPMMKPVEVGNGWYLRGDVGYTGKLSREEPTFNTFSVANNYRAGTVTGSSVSDDISAGIGIGYIFSDLIRADATLDVFKGGFTTNGTGLDTCAIASPANTSCSFSKTGEYRNYMAMANAYVDLGTISGFTPYVGAGAGFTKVQYRTATSVGTCVDGIGACGTMANVISSHTGQSEWRKTWALMAGVSYDLTHNVKIDLGYKYSKIGSGDNYAYNAEAITAGAVGSQGRDGGFERHEIRAGMRFAAW